MTTQAPEPAATEPAIGRVPGAPRGQIIVIFAFLLTILLGMAAFVVDLAWIWSNQLQVQRAADAGALAGVVHLPGDPIDGIAAAKAESRKNGFEDLVDGVVIVANPDPEFDRRMIVNVSAPVDTFFLGIFGFDTINVSRTAKAEFVLPVPMGSPENYYGVFGMTRQLTSTEDVTVTNNVTTRGWSCGTAAAWPTSGGCTGRLPSTAPAGTGWTATSGTLAAALTNNEDAYARSNVSGALQQWGGFAAQSGMPNPAAGETLGIVGLQVRFSDAFINTACASAHFHINLSWNGGTSWTPDLDVPSTITVPPSTPSASALTTGNTTDYVVGSNTSMTTWGPHAWVRADFSDANFRVRLAPFETCTGSPVFSLDRLEVRVTWDFTTPVTTTTTVTTNLTDQLLRGPGTSCTSGKMECFEADGVALNPRGFWGTLNTQGAENVNGDAYQPGYDTRTGGVSPACVTVTDPDRACYDGSDFYNYGIEMPAGSTGGSVYVYDPGFCDVNEERGTGDRWFGGDTAVSTFYTLYNTQGTLSDPDDDGTPIAASAARFRGMDADDTTMGGAGGAVECRYLENQQYGDGRDWHNRWYLVASGLTGGANGTIYRLHTTSTDPSSPTQQLAANGENSFAIFASASGAAPKVYGIGAMQAYTPLSAVGGGTVSSEFYLAQIESVHAGKTVEIHLWDPGDTQNLAARLQILVPNATDWVPTTFSYTAKVGTSNSNATASCNTRTGTANEVTTNTGGTSRFNGCWLTIRAVIPDDYTAPQDGWWKIRYIMTGDDTSFDVTTWTVNIIGNPVHLILPD